MEITFPSNPPTFKTALSLICSPFTVILPPKYEVETDEETEYDVEGATLIISEHWAHPKPVQNILIPYDPEDKVSAKEIIPEFVVKVTSI